MTGLARLEKVQDEFPVVDVSTTTHIRGGCRNGGDIPSTNHSRSNFFDSYHFFQMTRIHQ